MWRCLADSNCCRRFCRPLTKPLIQGTNKIYNLTISLILLNKGAIVVAESNLLFERKQTSFVELRCKGTTKSEKRKVKREKFLSLRYFFSFYSGFACFSLLHEDFSSTFYIYTARQVTLFPFTISPFTI